MAATIQDRSNQLDIGVSFNDLVHDGLLLCLFELLRSKIRHTRISDVLQEDQPDFAIDMFALNNQWLFCRPSTKELWDNTTPNMAS